MKWPRVYILFLIISFLLFFFKGYLLLDSDFGWHLRIGQLILKSGIPKTDPFSYTMPSYPFVDHEWFTNVLIALFYPILRELGLSLVFALLSICSLILASRLLKFPAIPMFFLLAATVIAPFAGVRTQVITWVFYSLLLLIIFDSHFHKYKYFLPLIFLFWANMHGGFVVGIISLVVIILVKIIINKEIIYSDFLILFLSIISTFINPYRYRIWWEIWMQISDQTLRWTISEWMPSLFDPLSISLMLFISMSLANCIIFWRKIEKSELVLYFCLFLAGQTSQRHIPLWVICALPMLNYGYANLKLKAGKFIYGAARFAVLERFGGIFIFVVIVIQIGLFALSLKDSVLSLAYPVKAVNYLRLQNPSGNIFSVYNWGGYLDLNLAGKKVFIDGRMPSWRWKSPNSHESDYAFLDYLKLGDGSLAVSNIIRKYNITLFLLPVEPNLKQRENSWLNTVLFKRFALKNHHQKKINLSFEVKELGFKQVFKDNTAEIWEKQ